MKNTLNRSKENKVYLSVIVTLIILFAVFFTSKSWMYDDSVIAQTAYNEDIKGLDQTTLKLINWSYNPENQLMEIKLEKKHKGGDEIEPTFSLEAKAKESKETYATEKVYESDDVMVIHIEEVPHDYRVIGLFVNEHRDEKILQQQAYMEQELNGEYTDDVAKKNIKKSDLSKPKQVIIVGDYREIEEDRSLIVKSDEAYQQDNIELEMNRIRQEIITIMDDNIPLQKELIAKLQKEIYDLTGNLTYQTDNEKVETEKENEQKEDAIQNAKKKIESDKERLKDLRDQYHNREKKRDRLMHDEPQNNWNKWDGPKPDMK